VFIYVNVVCVSNSIINIEWFAQALLKLAITKARQYVRLVTGTYSGVCCTGILIRLFYICSLCCSITNHYYRVCTGSFVHLLVLTNTSSM